MWYLMVKSWKFPSEVWNEMVRTVLSSNQYLVKLKVNQCGHTKATACETELWKSLMCLNKRFSTHTHTHTHTHKVFPLWSRASQVALVVKKKKIHLPHKRCRFSRWVGKISLRRKWQPTSVFLPGESHGQRSLASYSSRGHKLLDTTEQLSTPVVKTPQFHCKGHGFDNWSGN